VESSGFLNAELTAQVGSTSDKLAVEGTLTDFLQDTATLACTSAFIAMTITFGEAMRSGHGIDNSVKRSLECGRRAFGFATVAAIVSELTLI
jgi:hypothetical protein